MLSVISSELFLTNKKETIMKTLAALIGSIAPATAFAAGNVPAGDDGIFVWIFLGFFAMIVVGQLIPAVLLVMGLFKGITAKTEAKNEAR
jgi:hypothetical protein